MLIVGVIFNAKINGVNFLFHFDEENHIINLTMRDYFVTELDKSLDE
jgi:hypothetical protein